MLEGRPTSDIAGRTVPSVGRYANPAIRVFQKDALQALVIALPALPVVGRVQLEQGYTFPRTPDIHCIGLQRLDSQRSCLLRPVCVDLNCVRIGGRVAQQLRESHAITYARIKRGKAFGEPQSIPQALGPLRSEVGKNLVWFDHEDAYLASLRVFLIVSVT